MPKQKTQILIGYYRAPIYVLFIGHILIYFADLQTLRIWPTPGNFVRFGPVVVGIVWDY